MKMKYEARALARTVLSSIRAKRVFELAGFLLVAGVASAWTHFDIPSDRPAATHKVNRSSEAANVAAGSGASGLASTSAVRDVPAGAPDSIELPKPFERLFALPPDVLGQSGKLRVAYKTGTAPKITKAVVAIKDAISPLKDFHLITLRPASDEHQGRLGLYYIGKWPAARTAKGGAVDYTPPSGFVEVTPANMNTYVSEHFRIRDFLTHDQKAVWPKYVAVNLKLVDKLELVLEDLAAHGVDTRGATVMSGFRTPQYNTSGGDPRGRAELSRHMYGDAADIFIDHNGSGRMSDLTGNGRVGIKDARVILAAVDRVEQAHPSLVGGAGVYAGNSSHGPFIHIDTRGYAARWVGTGE